MALVIVNVIDLGLCVRFFCQSASLDERQTSYLKSMRIMGLIFTLVALYRSIFVSRYLYQYAWFDTLANSSLIIRTFAVFAELSFAGLIAMAMLRFNRDMSVETQKANGLIAWYSNLAPRVLVICIFLAQFFAYGGLIIKSRLSFAIEETLWSAGFFAFLPVAVIQFQQAFFSKLHPRSADYSMLRSFAAVNLGWCIIYCTYALVYHLPTEYWQSAFEQIRTGVPEMKTGMNAITDALKIVHVNHNYDDWGFGFVIWHSAYFSICVWIAIFLMRAPRRLSQ